MAKASRGAKRRTVSARRVKAKKSPATAKKRKKKTRATREPRAASKPARLTPTRRAAAAQLKALYATGMGPAGRFPSAAARAAMELAAGDTGPAVAKTRRGPLELRIAAPPALSASQGAAPAGAPNEPVLDVHEIQGNILVGFNKDFQALLFFRITKVAVAKQWLREITPRIATVAEILAERRLFRAMRARTMAEPQGMVATWINIALTNNGVRQLTSDQDLQAFTDLAFKSGMPLRAESLHDPVDAQGEPTGWVVGAGDTYPEVLLIVASDRHDMLRAEVAQVVSTIESLQGGSPRRANTKGLYLIYEQEGADLGGGLKGHEHFGFKDGISQPGVRGRISTGPEDFLTPRLIDPLDALAPTHSRPGQPLIWPGQFVMGSEYPRQALDDPVAPGLRVAPKPVWAKNGSYLVFRRLRQHVSKFWAFMQAEAERLAAMPQFAGMSAIRLASLCVGRWPSGAPVMRTSLQDDAELATNDAAVNHFNFTDATLPVRMRPESGSKPDTFAQAPADRDGLRCPFGSHARKVNPRDDTTEQGAPRRTLLRRILRRGIPYGPPVADPLRPRPDRRDRGLLFLSYQTSIDQQFEFLMTDWTNVVKNPRHYDGPGGEELAGHDPIMGQESAPPRERNLTLTSDGQRFETCKLHTEWVEPTGGGYFFAPSISALRDVLSA